MKVTEKITVWCFTNPEGPDTVRKSRRREFRVYVLDPLSMAGNLNLGEDIPNFRNNSADIRSRTGSFSTWTSLNGVLNQLSWLGQVYPLHSNYPAMPRITPNPVREYGDRVGARAQEWKGWGRWEDTEKAKSYACRACHATASHGQVIEFCFHLRYLGVYLSPTFRYIMTIRYSSFLIRSL